MGYPRNMGPGRDLIPPGSCPDRHSDWQEMMYLATMEAAHSALELVRRAVGDDQAIFVQVVQDLADWYSTAPDEPRPDESAMLYPADIH